MEGSVSDESGVTTEVDQSIQEDEEEECRTRKEETQSLRREFWITASLERIIQE